MLGRLALVFTVAAASLSAAPQTQATPPAKTGLILGRAIDGTSGKPLGGVTVVLGGPPVTPGAVPTGAPPEVLGSGPPRVLTNAEGYFLFHGLPEGVYTLNATKTGYLTGAAGRRSPVGGSPPIALAAAERKSGVTVKLWKYAAIAGTVVDERGEPLIGVQVRVLRRTLVAGQYRLMQTGNMPSTDDRGVYRISSLEPGDYVAGVVSTRAVVPLSTYEQVQKARASGDLEATRQFDLSMFSGPGNGVRVGSFVVQSGSQGGGASDDAPMILPATERGPLFVYPTTYFPGTAAPASAAVLTLGSGEERGNIDFQLKPVPSVSVSGTVAGPGGPSANTALYLLAAGSDYLAREGSFETATTISDVNGAFTFLGVTPGQYLVRVLRPPARPVSTSTGFATVIQTGNSMISSGGGPVARPPIPNEPTWWAAQSISVGESDVTGVSVTLRTGARISGRVEFDGTAARPDAGRLQTTFVTIEPGDGRTIGGSLAFNIRQAQLDAEGRLTSYEQPAGTYVIRPSAPGPGWTLASVMLNGIDVSVTPFELGSEDVSVVIKYTDRPSELSGTVRDDRARPDSPAVVLVFPADPRAWAGYGSTSRRFQTSRAAATGSFRVVGLAAGDYLVAAVPEERLAEWRDPAFLKKLVPAAARVTIAEGQKPLLDLKVSDVR
jgi:hypothetical protein